ncbi:TIGR02588 family protein [Neorhizobium galegae]|uniref:TIGR02588 family protein n=1 Tax=Neorhizobium galegae TaxID=399 RepID=UPI0006226655|nr:TIGR02588 family protein [Neorhizobium galegae]CDZ60314.1 TIGR02588 family protein [Neorhizobium galegae bv. orientalis]KAB1120938.1 TIGR02588 family protein [Neorhizobium galegae]MCQ1810333.1 TIGR02588 family protein [Neorhizobium galegae]CDZ64571.1 TIGR02588 family protein [Neorhizobium galegae bv. orientalis]CDZ71916.1 TIGR02588 family protein [Neorhizobium galegae bv. orientalis]
MTTTANKRHTEVKEPHWIEWATGTVSALVVVATIAWVAYQAWTHDDMQPELSVAITERRQTEGGYRVAFDIANKATATAAAVTVRGEILDGGNIVEDADVTFDYVPAQSKSSGAILFSQDPGAREVRVRAVGYIDP